MATMSREQYIEQILAGEITQSEAAVKLGLRDGRSLSPHVVAARKRLGGTNETATGAKTKTKTIVEKVIADLRRMDAKTFLEQSEPVQQAIRTLLSL